MYEDGEIRSIYAHNLMVAGTRVEGFASKEAGRKTAEESKSTAMATLAASAMQHMDVSRYLPVLSAIVCIAIVAGLISSFGIGMQASKLNASGGNTTTISHSEKNAQPADAALMPVPATQETCCVLNFQVGFQKAYELRYIQLEEYQGVAVDSAGGFKLVNDSLEILVLDNAAGQSNRSL